MATFISKQTAQQYLTAFWAEQLTPEDRADWDSFEYWLWDICTNPKDYQEELCYAVHVMTQGMEFPHQMESEEFIAEFKQRNGEMVDA